MQPPSPPCLSFISGSAMAGSGDGEWRRGTAARPKPWPPPPQPQPRLEAAAAAVGSGQQRPWPLHPRPWPAAAAAAAAVAATAATAIVAVAATAAAADGRRSRGCSRPGPGRHLRKRNPIGPFQVSHHAKPKVKVRIRLNLHGIITVESASLIEDDVTDPALRATAASNVDNVQPDFASGAPNSEGNSIENGNFSHPEPGYLPHARSAEDLPAETDGTKMGRPSRRFEIPVTEACGGMTKAELSEAEAHEVQLASHDRMVERTKEKKNALEAYVYEIRNKLFEKYRSFTTEPEREEISRNLQQTEDWLYEEGGDESENVYCQKLDELKKLVDPIEIRFKEEEARAHQVRELLNCIVDYRMAVQSFPPSDRDAVIEECSKAEQWIRERSQLQESLPKNTDPILWSGDIKNQIEALHTACQQIMKPKGSHSRPHDSNAAEPH